MIPDHDQSSAGPELADVARYAEEAPEAVICITCGMSSGATGEKGRTWLTVHRLFTCRGMRRVPADGTKPHNAKLTDRPTL